MAVTLLSSRLAVQPQYPAQINSAWADRMTFCVMPALGAFNLAVPGNSIGKASIASSPRYCTYGAGQLTSNGSSTGWTVAAPLGSNGYTLFSVVLISGGATQSIIDDDGGTRAFQFRYGGASNVEFIPFSGGTPGTISTGAISATDLAGGFPTAATATSAGATAVWYRKSKVTGSLGGAPTTPTGTYWLGCRKNGSQAMSGNEGIMLACGWSRVLQDVEILALMENPWAIFGSQPSRLYVPAAAGGTLKTYNGLAKASIKTFQGLAKASTKTVNGLTP